MNYYGFNPQGYGQPAQVINADTIIQELNNAINAVLNGQVGDIMFVKRTIDRMVSEGKIREVGGGSNRVIVEIVPDHTALRNMLQIPGPVIVKVPVKLPEGIRDNLRASYVWTSIRQSGMNTSPEMQLIRQRALPSTLIPNTHLLVQEKVTRIEDSIGVQQLLASGKYRREDQIAKACRDYIMENPNVYSQYYQLLSAMDMYFVMADLNVEFSALNFGFRQTPAGEMFTILDYGYVQWKDKPLNCPKCGKPLRYVIPGEEFLKESRNKAIAANAMTFGLYSCKNHNCNFNPGSGVTTSYFEKDISVFMKYTNG